MKNILRISMLALTAVPAGVFAAGVVLTASVPAIPDTLSTVSVPVSGASFVLPNADGQEVVLQAPPSVYPADLSLQVLGYPSSDFLYTDPAPAGEGFVGHVYDFNFRDSGGAPVHGLVEPVTVSLPYSPFDIAGLDESTLSVWTKESGADAWRPVPGAIVDAANDRIIFTTATFSMFAIFGQAAAERAVPAASPASGGFFGQSSGGNRPNSVVLALPSPLPSSAPLERKGARADLDGSGATDLADFSILAYWYGRKNPPAEADFNGDGKVDLADFSVLAYYWGR